MVGIRISNDQAKFAAKNMKAKCIACELLVKRVVALYRNQRPVYLTILSDTEILSTGLQNRVLISAEMIL